MQGWRNSMEDEHLIALNKGKNQSTHIFGVFDGHGGYEVARYIKNHFVDIFLSNQNYKDGLISQALKETFSQINANLNTLEACKELTKYHRQFQQDYNIKPSETEKITYEKKGYLENLAYEIGSTCNVLIIYDNEFYFANCGDSRSLLLRHGEAIAMSTDHKPDMPLEFKRIKRSGSYIKDGRVDGALNLSRSIGDLQFKRGDNDNDCAVTCIPDVLNETVNPYDDFIIIACDGVWDCISNEQMSNFIYSRIRNGQNNLEKILDELFQKNVAKSADDETGTDNMTCIIIMLKKEGDSSND